jgi:hypothetical protein
MANIPGSKLHGYRVKLESHDDFKAAKRSLEKSIDHMARFEDAVVAALPGLGGSFVDSPLTPGVGGVALPQPCSFTVTILSGLADIEIVLPQFAQASTPKLQQRQIVANPNALLATILHNVQSCSDDSFSVSKGLRDYQPTSQTQILKPDTNTFWRMRSSYDGKNFNVFSAVQRSH